MSAEQENFSVPGMNLGQKRPKKKRRSSILKTAKPFEDIQNVQHGDERLLKDRRVSFCNTVEIKEFLKELPSHTRQPALMGKPQKSEELPLGEVRKVDLAVEDESFIQFSTPAGKKRRRISFHTGAKIERLSIIPKLEKSFSINDDGDNFEPFVDLEDDPLEQSGAIAKKEDITLIEELPEPEAGFPQNDFFSTQGDHQVDHLGCPSGPVVVLPTDLTRDREASDMDLTCNELSLLDAEELLKQLQGGEHTGALLKAKKPSEMQPKSHMSFTCVDSMPFHAQSIDSEVHAPTEKKSENEMSFTCVDPVPAQVQPMNVSPRMSENGMSKAQPDSRMSYTSVGKLPTQVDCTSTNGDQVSVCDRDDGSEMSLSITCTEIEEDTAEAVQSQLVLCDDHTTVDLEFQKQDVKGAVTDEIKAPKTSPTEAQMPINCTPKTIGPVLFQDSSQKSTETMYEASMSLTYIHTEVSDAVSATIEQGLKFSSMESTKSIPKLDRASKLASPTVQMEVQSQSDMVVPGPTVEDIASENFSTMLPNIDAQVPPTNTTLREASQPAAAIDNTSVCPNLKPINQYSSSPPLDRVFKHPQLPLKLAKHNIPKSKSVIQPIIMPSPAPRAPQSTPVILPPPGSNSLSAAHTAIQVITTPGSLLRPGGVTPSRCNLKLQPQAAPQSSITVAHEEEEKYIQENPGTDETHTSLSITHPNLPLPAPHVSELHVLSTQPEETMTTNPLEFDYSPDHHPQSNSRNDWLHSMAEDSFSLVGTSFESDPSPEATERVTNTATAASTHDEFEDNKTKIQCKHSVHQEFVASTGSSLSQLKKAVKSLKDDANHCKDETMVVETPEAIPVKRRNAMKDVSPTPGLGRVIAAEVSQESLQSPLGQSVMMSPNAFSKFLGALKCDKSMSANSFYVSPTQLVEGNTEDMSATSRSPEPTKTSPKVKPQQSFLLSNGKLSKREIHENSECKTMPNDLTASSENSQQEEPSVIIEPDEPVQVNTTFTLEKPSPLQQPSGIVHVALDTSMDTLSEEKDASHVNHTHHNPELFSVHSQDLHNRLSAAAEEIQLRLTSADYLSSDGRIEATLKCWLQVLNMYLCSLSTVIQFGGLSGLSVTHLCDIPQLISCPPVSREDMTGSKQQKAQWIWEMIQWILELHPIIQATLDEAASLYPWEIVRWSEEEVEVEVQSHMTLKLKLKLMEYNPQQTDSFNKKISDIYTDPEQDSWTDCKRKATIDQCRYTADIAEMLWKLAMEEVY